MYVPTHCYFKTVNFSGISLNQVNECQNKLVSEIEKRLPVASEQGRLNLVYLNHNKTKVCTFTGKKTSFVVFPRFKNYYLTASANISFPKVDYLSTTFSSTITLKVRLSWMQEKWAVLIRSRQYSISVHHSAQLYGTDPASCGVGTAFFMDVGFSMLASFF